MQNQIHPPEVLEFTTEAYLPTVSVRRQVIYVSVILAIVAALACLPLVQVKVSIQSTGIIRPTCERNEIRWIKAK
jgi:membrane fusion protein, peptide pheromone/bacteriocin exporter